MKRIKDSLTLIVGTMSQTDGHILDILHPIHPIRFAVSWCSRKQRVVLFLSKTRSTWVLRGRQGMHLPLNIVKRTRITGTTKLTSYNDNQSVVHFPKCNFNSVFHSRSKYIDIRAHFIPNALQGQLLTFDSLPTEEMVAGKLTKALPRQKHELCTIGLGFFDKDNFV